MKLACCVALIAIPFCAHAAARECATIAADADGAPSAWRKNVAVHNCVRRTAKPATDPPLAPLRWSDDIARNAERHARQCVWAHSHTPGLGENIHASAPWNAAEAEAAIDWTAEARDYDYTTNTCANGAVCGHYTQMVARSSNEIGCGIANCSTGSPFGARLPQWTFVVCDYRAPGNYIGRRPY
jgi:pathogenesis-related protein 1